jgi:hypothetical protein
MSFMQLIKFETAEGETLFADIGKSKVASLSSGSTLTAYPSFDAALTKEKARKAKFGKVGPLRWVQDMKLAKLVVLQLCAPVPNTDIPTYCVGRSTPLMQRKSALVAPILARGPH